MKILSWNVNGLRAVYKRNFLKWLEKSQADVVCLQEIKAQKEQLPSELLQPRGYQAFFNSARKKGYSGVAVYSKDKPLKIKRKLGLKRFDQEGRILELHYPGLILINLYLPHGGHQKENLAYKLAVYERLFAYLGQAHRKRVVMIGDLNVAHQEIDLARPKQNRNNIMFTLEERKQIDRLVKLGFIDSFRRFHPEGGHYSWWPYGYHARERNLGWRIDYAFIAKKLSGEVEDAYILSEVKGSDHCPIGIEVRI